MKRMLSHSNCKGVTMGSDIRDIIINKTKREMLVSLLSKGERVDSRKFGDYRAIEIQKNVIDTADGSALAKIGKTNVLAAVKFAVSVPYPDRPKEGTMIAGAEFLQLAHPRFESGPPREEEIELARVVDRGIRSAEAIDFNSFFVEDGKVLIMFLDFYVLDDGGNMLDTAGLAAAAALTCTKVPKVENGAIVVGEYDRDLNPKVIPIPVTSVKIGHYWMVDPILEEEESCDTRLTITTTDEHVCSMQKGQGQLSKDELLNNINTSFNISRDIRRLL